MWDDLLVVSLTNPIVRSVITGAVRSVVGYIENVVVKRQKFSFRMLVETIMRTIPQALGLSAAGIPPEAALVTDYVITKVA